MNTRKRKKLEAAGWKVGAAEDFLGLTTYERAIVALKLALRDELKDWRTRGHMTQAALAKRLNSSQSRVAKMEAGDPSVSVDLLIRALIAAGASQRDIGRAISRQAVAA